MSLKSGRLVEVSASVGRAADCEQSVQKSPGRAGGGGGVQDLGFRGLGLRVEGLGLRVLFGLSVKESTRLPRCHSGHFLAVGAGAQSYMEEGMPRDYTLQFRVYYPFQ